MLQFLSKKQFNIGFILIVMCLLPLQFISSLSTFNLNVWQSSAPLAEYIYKSIGTKLLSNIYFDFIISTILISIQLIIVYNIFNKIKNIDKHSVLATWLYLWLIHLFPSMSCFSPALISSTIMFIVLYKLYAHIEDNSSSYLFNISMLSGLSFLIWYPSIFVLAFIFIGLFQYNELKVKKLVIISTSFFIPIIYFFTYYLFQDRGIEILIKFSNFHIYGLSFPSLSLYQALCLIPILIMLILGTLRAISIGSQTVKSSRLFMNSILSLLLVTILSVFLSPNNIIYSGLTLFFPLSLFLAYYINIFKRPLFAEVAHLSLILLIIINYTLSF